MRRSRRGTASRGAAAGEGDWVLPPALAQPSGAVALTRVGTVDGEAVVTVDGRGLVSVPRHDDLATPAWSLDWWVGADDRWHLASLEPGLRQRLVDAAPVVETAMRIPSGDAVHRAYVVQGPAFGARDDHLVVEVTNASPVPFALALVIRPFTPTGWSHLADITIAATGGGVGRDRAHLVSVDGAPAMVLPRAPARAAQGDGRVDVADVVTSGGAPDGLGPPTGGPHATAAFIVPVTHTTTVRVVLPLGAAPGAAVDLPSGLPPVENVVSGWAAHTRRGVRTEVPDTRLAEGIGATRAALLLAAATAPADLAIQAELVAALDRDGFHDEAAALLGGWPDLLVAAAVGSVQAEGALAAIVDHWRLTRDDALTESLLREVVALAKAGHRSRAARTRADGGAEQARRMWAFAEMLAGIGQTDAAEQAARDADAGAQRARGAGRPAPEGRDPWAALRRAVEGASPTWAWPEGPVGAARFLGAVRAVLVEEQPGQLALLPAGLGAWWGQGIELHDAPTPFGLLSFALRWHGERPALLWELAAHDGVGEVVVATPALDPAWRSADRRGEALLAAVPRPADVDGDRPSVIPQGMGKAESVAPRSVLPLVRPEDDTHPPAGDDGGSGTPPGQPSTTDQPGDSFS